MAGVFGVFHDSWNRDELNNSVIDLELAQLDLLFAYMLPFSASTRDIEIDTIQPHRLARGDEHGQNNLHARHESVYYENSTHRSPTHDPVMGSL